MKFAYINNGQVVSWNLNRTLILTKKFDDSVKLCETTGLVSIEVLLVYSHLNVIESIMK